MQGTCVFPSPSKIPYGGFSPVRLQTEIQPQPSLTPQELSAARMLPETRTYMRSEFKHPPSAAHSRAPRSRIVYSRSKRRIGRQHRTIPSRGPWLPCGLYCPAGSSLTMASSEPLAPIPPPYAFAGGSLQLMGLHRAGCERFPNLLLASIPSCRPPYPGGPDGCLWLCFTIHTGLRRLRIDSASTSPIHHRFWHGSCNGAARFVFVYYGLKVRWPCTDKGFYFRAFADWITPDRRRI
jgi:hypothetical protein